MSSGMLYTSPKIVMFGGIAATLGGFIGTFLFKLN
jgi:hypothetical protein